MKKGISIVHLSRVTLSHRSDDRNVTFLAYLSNNPLRAQVVFLFHYWWTFLCGSIQYSICIQIKYLSTIDHRYCQPQQLFIVDSKSRLTNLGVGEAANRAESFLLSII